MNAAVALASERLINVKSSANENRYGLGLGPRTGLGLGLGLRLGLGLGLGLGSARATVDEKSSAATHATVRRRVIERPVDPGSALPSSGHRLYPLAQSRTRARAAGSGS